MGKGYAEGSAVEERLAALERGGDDLDVQLDAGRAAVYGSTDDEPEQHFIGWLDDVDPDALFAAGQAWGLQVVRRKDGAAKSARCHSSSSRSTCRRCASLNGTWATMRRASAGSSFAIAASRRSRCGVGSSQLPSQPAQERHVDRRRRHSRLPIASKSAQVASRISYACTLAAHCRRNSRNIGISQAIE